VSSWSSCSRTAPNAWTSLRPDWPLWTWIALRPLDALWPLRTRITFRAGCASSTGGTLWPNGAGLVPLDEYLAVLADRGLSSIEQSHHVLADYGVIRQTSRDLTARRRGNRRVGDPAADQCSHKPSGSHTAHMPRRTDRSGQWPLSACLVCIDGRTIGYRSCADKCFLLGPRAARVAALGASGRTADGTRTPATRCRPGSAASRAARAAGSD